MNLLVETDVPCPWCGEYYATTVDTSQGGYTTTEDCAVCCRPNLITLVMGDDGDVEIQADQEYEA